MSNDQSDPVRKIIPYKPGKRVSTFRKLNLDFAGTALEQALAEAQKEESTSVNSQTPQITSPPPSQPQPPSPPPPAQPQIDAASRLDGQPYMQPEYGQEYGHAANLDGEPYIPAVQPPEPYGEPSNPAVQIPVQTQYTASRTAIQPSGRPDVSTPGREAVQPSYLKTDSDYASRIGKYKVTVRLPEEKILRIKAWCVQNRRDLQDVLEEALDVWTASRPDVFTAGQPGGQPSHDHDHDIDRLIEDLIKSEPLAVYKKLTRNTPLERDREAMQDIASLDPLVIKFGIATSIERSKTKIFSMKYCIPAIREIAEKYNNRIDPDYFGYLIYRLVKSNKILM